MERHELSLAGSPSAAVAQRVDFDTREQWDHILEVIRKDVESCVQQAVRDENLDKRGEEEVRELVTKSYLEPVFQVLALNTTINSQRHNYPHHHTPERYAPRNEELHLQVENYQEKLFGVMMKNTTDRKRLPEELRVGVDKLLSGIVESFGSGSEDVEMDQGEPDKEIIKTREAIQTGMETVHRVLRDLPGHVEQAERTVQVQQALKDLKER